jgi:hypothetical protein
MSHQPSGHDAEVPQLLAFIAAKLAMIDAYTTTFLPMILRMTVDAADGPVEIIRDTFEKRLAAIAESNMHFLGEQFPSLRRHLAEYYALNAKDVATALKDLRTPTDSSETDANGSTE